MPQRRRSEICASQGTQCYYEHITCRNGDACREPACPFGHSAQWALAPAPPPFLPPPAPAPSSASISTGPRVKPLCTFFRSVGGHKPPSPRTEPLPGHRRIGLTAVVSCDVLIVVMWPV
jgi:hypothetical protein